MNVIESKDENDHVSNNLNKIWAFQNSTIGIMKI